MGCVGAGSALFGGRVGVAWRQTHAALAVLGLRAVTVEECTYSTLYLSICFFLALHGFRQKPKTMKTSR